MPDQELDVLVVCVGNLCRSPFAEALLRQALPRARVASAGLAAPAGEGADALTRSLAAQQGLLLEGHRARRLQAEHLLAADLVLAMSRQQVQQIISTWPHARGRVFRLGEHIQRDIPDPYRQPPAVHREVHRLINEAVAAWVGHLGGEPAPLLRLA